MKKFISLLLVMMLALSFAACGGNTESPTASPNAEQQTEAATPTDNQQTVDETPTVEPTGTPEGSSEELGAFNKNAVLEETVMYDENDVKITATGLSYTSYYVELELTIENNSDKDLSFTSGSLGYCCNSINGYMVSNGYLYCDVPAGKKAKDSISFSYDDLMLYGINEIADMEIGFEITDDDYNETYTDPCQITTSAFDSHDYTTNHYQATITSPAAMNTYGYEIKLFSEDTLYDDNGIKHLSSVVMVDSDGDTMLLLEFENTSDSILNVTTSNIAINNLLITNSTWSSDTIIPNKHGIIFIDLTRVLEEEYWDIYGIEEVGTVSLSLGQRDIESNRITDDVPVEIVVPDAKAEFDPSGKEIYNNGGLRIIAKTVLEDPSEYSSAMYILLLAENNSGKTLAIDDKYDSLSINGFMIDYIFDNTEIDDGESAVIEIWLFESSLEDNDITSVSDIEEIEIGLEIEYGRNTFDEPTLNIVFE